MATPTIIFGFKGDFDQMSLDDLTDNLRHHNRASLFVPLPTVGVTNDHLDIAEDCAYAAYMIEVLSADYRVEKFRRESVGYVHYVAFDLIYDDAMQLSRALYRLQFAVNYGEDEQTEAIAKDVHEQVLKFYDQLDDIDLRIPYVADDHYANLVSGAYYSHPEMLEEATSRFPERRLDYWRSCYFDRKNDPVLTSIDTWIFSSARSIEEVFRKFGYEELSTISAHLLSVGSRTFVTCGTSTWRVAAHHVLTGAVALNLISEDRHDSFPLRGYDSALVSEFGDFIILQSSNHSMVVFDAEEVATEELSTSILGILSSIEDQTGPAVELHVPWAAFTDEQFELLCYDVIYSNSRFDRETIRKMGRSRSRDGGRDITVMTKARPTEEPKLFIFQCKAINPDRSLSAATVGSVSDVIDQYGAQGYGVMTTGVIDATLYDRLDGIQRNRGIEMSHWSRLELERFLVRRPELLRRHLAAAGAG